MPNCLNCSPKAGMTILFTIWLVGIENLLIVHFSSVKLIWVETEVATRVIY